MTVSPTRPVSPVVVVLPTGTGDDAAAVVAVAGQVERAVLAADGGPARVGTVLLDTGPVDDPRRRDAFFAAPSPAMRCALTLPGATWGAAVARGFRHALQIGAGLVVLADAHTPTDPDLDPGQQQLPATELPATGLSVTGLPVTAAIDTLRAQPMPGVVCSPVALPWWQRLLAIHVLRPLLAPGLGLMLADPQPRTLVLSPRAAQVALAPVWRLDAQTWTGGHGLGILAAARRAGLPLAQTAPRIPTALPTSGTGLTHLIDRDTTLETLTTALATAPFAPAHPTTPIPPQPHRADTAPAGIPRRHALEAALDQASRARRELVLPDRPRAAWPDPLLDAWHAARALTPHLPGIADRLWTAYTHRAQAWLRTALHTDADLDRLTQSSIEATIAFLTATGTPIDTTTATPGREDHDRHDLPHTG